MGRPRKFDTPTQFNLKMEEDMETTIEDIAKDLDRKKSDIVRAWIKEGISTHQGEDLEPLEEDPDVKNLVVYRFMRDLLEGTRGSLSKEDTIKRLIRILQGHLEKEKKS